MQANHGGIGIMNIAHGIKSQHSERGFSLVDVAVIMAIVGVLVAGFLATYKLYQVTRATTVTEENFIAAQEALGAFIPYNDNTYPRPAAFGLTEGDEGYGEQIAAGDAIPSCNETSAVGHICRSTGYNGESVLIGVLPFGDLNMPEAQARDGYGRLFTYAVSEALTVANGAMPTYVYGADTNGDGVNNVEDDPTGILYKHHVCVKTRDLLDNGTFNTEDCTDAAGVNPARAIALVSHGIDGIGGWLPTGKLYAPCSPVSLTSQTENCNFDGTFIQSMRYTTNNNSTADISDDILMRQPMLVRGENANKNDDTVQVEVREDGNYWGNTDNDISNKYSYKVGIGVDAPTKPLEVEGNIRAEVGILSEELCTVKANPSDPDPLCLETEAIAGVKEEMDCGELGMVKQIHNNEVACVTLANPGETCPPGTVLVGVTLTGTADCYAVTEPLCGSAHGTAISTPPNAGERCAVGTDIGFSGSGPWTWQCQEGSKTVNCTTAAAAATQVCIDECGNERRDGASWCIRGAGKGMRRCSGTTLIDEGCISGIGCCAYPDLHCQ